MKPKTRIAISGLLVFTLMLVATPVLAAGAAPPGAGGGGNKFTNPLERNSGGNPDIKAIIIQIIQFLLGLVGALTVLGIVVGAIYIITAFGNDSKIQLGKKIIGWSIGGLILAALSFFIVQVVTNILGV